MVDVNAEADRIANRREQRVISQEFSICNYGEPWSKSERVLFIESLNAIRDFYTNKDASAITEYDDSSITMAIPITSLDPKLIKVKNRGAQLYEASKGLMQKTIQRIGNTGDSGQLSFRFINIYTFIEYNPEVDKDHVIMKIPKEIFKEMLPISAYASLDLLLLENIETGNAIRLYEVFKTWAYKGKFSVSFDFLRQQLGFMESGRYKVWKEFNRRVLKPAVEIINQYKDVDIEVSYKKARGEDEIEFVIVTHHKPKNRTVYGLDDTISPESRRLNMLQSKFIDTLIKNCSEHKNVKISSPNELKSWIVSDILEQQKKSKETGVVFDFKKSCNFISSQIRRLEYTVPYSHPDWMRIYHESEGNVFDNIADTVQSGDDSDSKPKS